MSEEIQQEVAEQQEAPETNQYENEARAQGWVGLEEFRGKEEDWVDAETFVRRGKEIMPILRKNNEKLLKELAEAKKVAEEAREAAKEFREYQKELTERKVKELNTQIEQLKQAKREAISAGDGDRVIAIDDAIDDIKEEQRATKEEAKAKVEEVKEQSFDPSLNEWLGTNSWFGQDQRMTAIANGVGEAIRRENPNLIGKPFLEQLDKELADIFPEKFGKKKTPNPMDGGGGGSAGRPLRGKKSYDNLPADAKAACDKFVKQGLMTREDYVKDYDWE